jgi:TolB-like protein
VKYAVLISKLIALSLVVLTGCNSSQRLEAGTESVAFVPVEAGAESAPISGKTNAESSAPVQDKAGASVPIKAGAEATVPVVPAKASAEVAAPVPDGHFERAYSGTGIRIAVLVPNYQNFDEKEGWIPIFTQGILTNNFSKYSAMTVIDRQNMDKILDEQKLSMSGNFSDDDYIRIGNLTNAQYILTGTILKISDNECSLQLAVSDTETSVRKASYAANCGINELKEATVLKDASYELLTQMGVRLTQTGKQSLYDSGNTSSFVESETALSQGIVAEKNGTTIEALSYYYSANYYDPASSEATSRLNVLSSTVSNGNIRETARNDIERRRAWQALMDECEAFFRDHPPFDLVYQTSLEQKSIDYINETINLTVDIGLFPTTGLKVLQNMLDGLVATGKRDEWGFQDWPLSASSDTFMSKDFKGFSISVSLLNDDNKIIANRRYNTKSPLSVIKEGNTTKLLLESSQFTWDFPPISVNDITDTVTVKIDSINDIPAETASANGYMRIVTEEEYKNALSIQPVEMVTVAERAKIITTTYSDYRDYLRDYAGNILVQSYKTLTMEPYMIGKDRISFQQWLVVKSWAEKNGYIFQNNGMENRRASIGANMSINYPVTNINIQDVMVWCNAYSEYHNKTPYYRERDNNIKIIKDANSMKAGWDFTAVDNGGYRLPSREEYCFAIFDGDPGLRSYNHSSYDTNGYANMDFSSKRFEKTQILLGRYYTSVNSDPISLFTPNGALNLIGLHSQSSEFVEPWIYETSNGYTYYKYLYGRHNERNTDGFRIACSFVSGRAIAGSVTERYAKQKKDWD